jgi:hypothetical protein
VRILGHDEALAEAAAATVRLVLAIGAWEDSLEQLAAATRRDREPLSDLDG